MSHRHTYVTHLLLFGIEIYFYFQIFLKSIKIVFYSQFKEKRSYFLFELFNCHLLLLRLPSPLI